VPTKTYWRMNYCKEGKIKAKESEAFFNNNTCPTIKLIECPQQPVEE
jgi:hypothetical protein